MGLVVGAEKIQPGLRQNPSSVAESGVEIQDGSELYPTGVGRDRAYVAE